MEARRNKGSRRDNRGSPEKKIKREGWRPGRNIGSERN
jgi:hypothetical protein